MCKLRLNLKHHLVQSLFSGMKADLDKFQDISISDKTQKLNLSFNSNEHFVTCDDDINLQGLTLDARMTFRTSKQEFKCFKQEGRWP